MFVGEFIVVSGANSYISFREEWLPLENEKHKTNPTQYIKYDFLDDQTTVNVCSLFGRQTFDRHVHMSKYVTCFSKLSYPSVRR